MGRPELSDENRVRRIRYVDDLQPAAICIAVKIQVASDEYTIIGDFNLSQVVYHKISQEWVLLDWSNSHKLLYQNMEIDQPIDRKINPVKTILNRPNVFTNMKRDLSLHSGLGTLGLLKKYLIKVRKNKFANKCHINLTI